MSGGALLGLATGVLLFIGSIMVALETWVLKELLSLRVEVTRLVEGRDEHERRIVELEQSR